MVELKLDLPESFLQEEERDGYLVTAEVKKLWAVEMDLLHEFDRVCKKHGLRYILDFGTLLGAIRHKGFIPWDDDIDVSMLREDFDKLMEIGTEEFKEPYFLQNYKTDPKYDIAVAKLRRSDTACLEEMAHEGKFNQGIFIDIFVFDNIPSKDVLESVTRKCYDYFHPFFVLCHEPSRRDGWKLPLTWLRYYLYKMVYGSARKSWEKLERYAKSFAPSGYVADITYIYEPCCRLRQWFESTTIVPFENMLLPAPVEYDALLRDYFGDYMIPVRGASDHVLLSFDVDRSYKDVLQEL